MLEDYSAFTAGVAAGNRVKFTSADRAPAKDEVSSADLPEVRLVPTVGTPHTERTSNSSSVVKRWEVQVSTGDQRLDVAAFPLEWEVLRAMHDWRTRLVTLEWAGKKYVKRCQCVESSVGVSNSDLDRGIRGWSTIMVLEVEMWFGHDDLRP